MNINRLPGSNTPRARVATIGAIAAVLFAAPTDITAETATASPKAAVGDRPVNLHKAIAALSSWVDKQGGQLGAAVVRIGSAAVLAEFDPDEALNPASNMKLLTAAAALDRLGPDYRYETGLYGRMQGDVVQQLVLRGHGDPALRAADLWRLASALANRGVRRIDGGVLVDQDRFDDKFVPPAFEQQPDEWAAFRAPVSAVALEANAITLNVLPTTAGQTARVWLEPRGFVDVTGTVATREPGSGQDVRLTLKPEGKRLRAVLGGHAAEGLPRLQFTRRVDDPRLMPGYVLVHLLETAGIEVQGDVALGGAKEQRRLVYVQSAPLSLLLHELGKHSDNFVAEMVLKALGAEARGAPGTSTDGAAAVVEWMKKAGAYTPDTRIINGSGLFDANRISAASLVRALSTVYQNPRIRPEYLSHLAIGGVDGTLRFRFRKHRDRRNVRAKTGTLARVDALSGYVLSPGGEDAVAFAFVVEGLAGQHAATRRRIDACVDAIVEHLWRG